MRGCEDTIIRGCCYTETSTSLPLIKMVTLRVLLFAINCCFGKDASNVRHGMGRRKPQSCFWLRFCFIDVRDNDSSGYKHAVRRLNG